MNINPQNEEQRVKNLEKYKILRTKSEPIFDEIVAAAATLFDVPIAMVNFVDLENKTDQGVSLCSLAVLNDHVAIFEKAIKKPYLVSNPLIAGYLGFRFYAAAHIMTNEGFNIGAVCIVDKVVRKFDEHQKQKLKLIAGMIYTELNKRDVSIC